MKRVDQGAKWTWSALRPGAIIGFSLVRTLLISPQTCVCARVFVLTVAVRCSMKPAHACSRMRPASLIVFSMVPKSPVRSL